MKSQEVRKINHNKDNSIGTFLNWHISQLPGFVFAEVDKWGKFWLQKASNVLGSLFPITKTKHDNLLEISMHSLVHTWARNRFKSKEEKAQAWRTIGSVLSLELSLQEPEIWHTHGKQLRLHVYSYLSLFIPEKGPSNRLEVMLPILLKCARFLNQIWGASQLSNSDFYVRYK